MKKIITTVMAVVLLATSTLAMNVDAKTKHTDLENVTAWVVQKAEFGYGMEVVNAESWVKVYPGGEVCLGKGMWTGKRAGKVVIQILKKDKKRTKKILGKKLYQKAVKLKNWKSATKTPITKKNKGKFGDALDSEISRDIQEKEYYKEIKSLIKEVKKSGIKDEKTIVYLADCYKQSSIQGKNIVKAAKKEYGSIAKINGFSDTLDKIHAVALKNAILGKYKARRNTTYKDAKDYDSIKDYMASK